MTISDSLKQYAGSIGFPRSAAMERILEILFDEDDDAKLAQAMPGTLPDLVKKTGWDENHVKKVIGKLSSRGAIGNKMDNPDLFRMFPAMIELRDMTVVTWKEAPQELFELWEKVITNETATFLAKVKKMKIPPMVRVIPVDHSIESGGSILDVDSARKIFRDAELISAGPCACRLQAKKNGKGQDCPAPENSVCMGVNGFAEHFLESGIGEILTNKEALKRVGDAEDAGLVHSVRNNIQKDMFMCNCCSCCCTGLYFINQLDYPGAYAPSRFRVKLDSETCTQCGTCIERCRFNAITMDDDMPIDLDKCYGCGNCVITCPEEALSMEEIRPVEHIRRT